MSDKHLFQLISVVVLLFFSVYFAFLYLGRDKQVPEIANEKEESIEKPNPNLRVLLSACKRVKDKTEVSGRVINTGNVDLRYVTVQSLFKDKNNRIIERGVIFVVKDVPLPPGESVDFRGLSKRTNVQKCNAEPLDWWS